MSNNDPKPGRWILPLVIIGMVGFTYLFVQGIEQPEISDSTLTGDTTTTTVIIPDSTPIDATDDPVVDPDVQTYLDGVAALQTRITDLTTRMNNANTGWDDRSLDFNAVKAELESLVADSTIFADDVTQAAPPASNGGLALVHEDLIAAAGAVKAASDAVLDGLVNAPTADPRIAALVTFNQASADFNAAALRAQEAGGS